MAQSQIIRKRFLTGRIRHLTFHVEQQLLHIKKLEALKNEYQLKEALQTLGFYKGQISAYEGLLLDMAS